MLKIVLTIYCYKLLQKEQLLEFLTKITSGSLGHTFACQHYIHVKDGPPVRSTAAMSFAAQVQRSGRKEIEIMLKEGIVEPANSEWASPMVIINKKDNTTHLCVDYQYTMTQVDAYPMLRVNDILD